MPKGHIKEGFRQYSKGFLIRTISYLFKILHIRLQKCTWSLRDNIWFKCFCISAVTDHRGIKINWIWKSQHKHKIPLLISSIIWLVMSVSILCPGFFNAVIINGFDICIHIRGPTLRNSSICTKSIWSKKKLLLTEA